MQRDQKLIEQLFFEVSDGYFKEQAGYRCRSEHGIFSFAAVVWLGILQRLSGNSLQKAIVALVEQVKAGELLIVLKQQVTKKVREGELSLNTGGISRARERLKEESVFELFEVSTSNMRARFQTGKNERRVYVMDGQVVAIARTESNLEGFCPTGNGEGELHFPRIRSLSNSSAAFRDSPEKSSHLSVLSTMNPKLLPIGPRTIAWPASSKPISR
jgi:hypothetical protein